MTRINPKGPPIAHRDPADASDQALLGGLLAAAIIVLGSIAGWAIIGAVIAWWGVS